MLFFLSFIIVKKVWLWFEQRKISLLALGNFDEYFFTFFEKCINYTSLEPLYIQSPFKIRIK